MSRSYRFIQVSLLGTLLLCLLVAWRRFTKSGATNTTIKHPVQTPADDALSYWTADKMRHAEATKMPNVDASDLGKRHPKTSRS